MILFGPPVKRLSKLDVSKINKLVKTIKTNYETKWVKRSLKIMEDSFVLKALTTTQNDRISPIDESNLLETAKPLLQAVIENSERLIYLDISNLPSQTSHQLHVDYAWIHVMSRRIHIPLLTNEKAMLAVLTEDNEIVTYHLEVGSIFEINNQTLHTAGNFGEGERWHLIADVISEDAYQFLLKMKLLDKPFSNKWNNFHFCEELKNKFQVCLKSKPTQTI